MEFTLVYRGPLKANGGIVDKQSLRRPFHIQLQQLWRQPPLVCDGPPDGHLLDDAPPDTSLSIIQRVHGFRFAPLVTSKRYLIAELDITMLRPGPPGSIVTQGGDIDNRLKTLFDSLRMPKDAGEIPEGDSPQQGEDPFFCLLEDDSLITRVSVGTDRLLEPYDSASFVNLMIRVKVKATTITADNIDVA